MGFNLKGGLSGAGSGAATGMAFGPWGAAAGGVLGGLMGGFTGGDEQELADPNFMQYAGMGTNNPLGGQSWSTGPDGKPVSNFGFTGQANDAFQGLLGGMKSAAGIDPAAMGQQASDKMYGVLRSRLDPQWQQNQKGFNSSMVNQGLDPGSEGFDNAGRVFGQQQNDAYSQASGQAIQLGQNEQQQARANAMMPFTQANSMMNMLNQQGSDGNWLDAAKAQYGAQLDKFSVGQKQDAGKKGGGGGLGGLFGGKGGGGGGGGGGSGGGMGGNGGISG